MEGGRDQGLKSPNVFKESKNKHRNFERDELGGGGLNKKKPLWEEYDFLLKQLTLTYLTGERF